MFLPTLTKSTVFSWALKSCSSFFLSLFSMVPNAESVDLPAVHQHLDRFIRITSAESDEGHQRPAVSCAGQLDSKIRRV